MNTLSSIILAARMMTDHFGEERGVDIAQAKYCAKIVQSSAYQLQYKIQSSITRKEIVGQMHSAVIQVHDQVMVKQQIHEIASLYDLQIISQKLKVKIQDGISLMEECKTLTSDWFLFKQILFVVIENAVQYSKQHGNIVISLSHHSTSVDGET